MEFNIGGYLIFAFVTAVTPGPNNLLLLSYGKAFGLKGSRNIVLGILIGFFVLLCLAGYGVAGIIMRNATLELTLRIIGSAWMFYLGILLCKLNIQDDKVCMNRIGFLYTFVQQFVNPKAWAMAISGAIAFLPQTKNIHLNVFIYASIFVLVGILCVYIWLIMGDKVSNIVKSERSNRILGYTMFSLMMISIVTIWI